MTTAIKQQSMGRVLVVDDHAQARESMSDILRGAGYRVQCCSGAREALARLDQDRFDLVITDLQMPGMTGLEFIRQIELRKLSAPVVMVTAHASISTAVEAVRHGAHDYIEKPFDVDQLEQIAARAIAHGHVLAAPEPSSDSRFDCPAMIGDSPQMRQLRERISQVAPTNETVLITGESGTGKELVARTLHAASARAAAPLISLNCPVLSAQLMESELFGHERGSFTGAESPRQGRFEKADGGTILLDEVTEIEPGLQAKLLRVLQERAFERVGSSETWHVDVRVIATTNRDLAGEVAEGRFRQDLYYRLAVVPIQAPALRERRGDIAALVDHFLTRAAGRLDSEPCRLTPAAMEMLLAYDWPGNVRELENIVTRASVLHPSADVGPDELRPWLLGAESQAEAGEDIPVGLSIEQMERKLIEATLAHHDGHRGKTAEALGIGVRTLSGKLRSYGYAPREKCIGG
jgi:DNA-binding NtrC family response regulator